MAYCQGNLPDLTEVFDRRPRNLSGDHVSDSCNLNVEPLFLQFAFILTAEAHPPLYNALVCGERSAL